MIIGCYDSDVYEIIQSNNVLLLKEHGLELVLLEKDLTYKDLDVLIHGRYNHDLSRHLPNIQMVIVPYTGLNGIDTALADKHSIVIKNSSAHGKFVAERAIALTLGVLGKLVYYHNNLAKGDWSHRMDENRVDWKTLMEKKVAIFGYGTIGKKIHDFLKAFDAEVGILNYKNRQYKNVQVFDDLVSLAKWSDVFIIAAPLDDRTRGIINKEVLDVLHGSLLINVARGAIINENDLYEALKNKHLLGFGSDVWFQYPTKEKKTVMPSKYPLERFDHVIMTPHCAGFEESSLILRCDDVVAQIIRWKVDNN